jgi:hypothetical protein
MLVPEVEIVSLECYIYKDDKSIDYNRFTNNNIVNLNI